MKQGQEKQNKAGRVQNADAPGVPTRRAALKLLDAVLRRGLALEQAMDNAAQGLAPNDRGLAHAPSPQHNDGFEIGFTQR